MNDGSADPALHSTANGVKEELSARSLMFNNRNYKLKLNTILFFKGIKAKTYYVVVVLKSFGVAERVVSFVGETRLKSTYCSR
jgi:hypothetical protein